MHATKTLFLVGALAAASGARAEVALLARPPVYADAKNVMLKSPEGVGCSATALVVADTGNARLVSYGWKDGVLEGGTEIRVPQLAAPVRVQLDPSGAMFVLDRKAKKIAKLSPAGAFQGWAELKEPGIVPGAFRVDGAGALYVLDVAGGAILVADTSGTVTRRLPVPKGALVTDLAVDPSGTIYALDARGAAVWSADKAATELKQLSRTLHDEMSFPAYLTTDGKIIYVVDQNGNGLVLLGPDGVYLGRRLAIGWGDGLVYYPSQLCLGSGGEVALADRGNNRVQLFTVTR
ncbi:MAG TPA: hypothetical protein VF832_20420 [Longimicrobiales bacterium]